jgi:pilus assembly protein Flp/PilA
MMLNLYLSIRNWLNGEEGQDLAEYGLLLGLIAVVVMIAVALLGDSLLAYFNVLAAAVEGWSGGSTG